jgi:hypothetical protein
MTDRYNRIYAALPHYYTATQLSVLGRWQMLSGGDSFTVLSPANQQPDAPSSQRGEGTFRSRKNCPAGKMQPL